MEIEKEVELTVEEWERAKQEWLTTEISLSALAKKYNVTFRRLMKEYKVGKWAAIVKTMNKTPGHKGVARRKLPHPTEGQPRLIPIDISDIKLTMKEFKFVEIYTSNGFNSIEAVRGAGYVARSNDAARSVAWMIQKKPHISEAIRRIVDAQLAPYKLVGMAKILDQLWKRCFYDISMFYNNDGRLKPLNEIDPEWRCVVDGVDRKYYGKNADVEVPQYQLPNRDSALKFLFNILTGSVIDGCNVDVRFPSESRERASKILQQARQEFEMSNGATVKITTTQQTVEISQDEPQIINVTPTEL